MAEEARQPDITAILIAHVEGTMVGVSFRSMLAAVHVAAEADLDVEMLLVLDEPDAATREMVAEVDTHGARLLEVSYGDQGLVRNHAVRESRGRFIALLDGDDLWTENWLVAAHALCAAEPRTIAHPYADWVFDERRSVSFPPDQTDPQFEPATLRVTNAWDALCLAPREAFLDHPFQPRDLAQGYAFEDWLWNLDTVRAGYVHRVVRDTIHFKRSRSGSQFRHASANQSITRPTPFHDYAWLQEWEEARKGPGTAAASSPLGVSRVAKSAKDRTLILHVGLHKTATSYVQNLLSARRHDLLREGVLYPTTGTVDGVTVSTREGAQSGHALLTRPGDCRKLVSELLAEIPDTASTVLLSSEDFTRPRADPEEYISRFSAFGSVQVVLVLRRQDVWIESYYKQLVDQYGNFETRSFDEFLERMGPKLLDFHTRFSPWRDLVGPQSFHVLSYDDLPGGAAICRRVLEIAGVGGSLLDDAESIPVPRYDSVRAIDTLGLRILNSYRLDNREVRTRIAKLIYAAAPDGDIELMTPEMRDGIQALCAPINERIEAEWFKEPVPGFRFGAALDDSAASPPTGPEVVDYLGHVISLCERVRNSAEDGQG